MRCASSLSTVRPHCFDLVPHPTPSLQNPTSLKKVSSFFPDELYQGYISGLPGGKWFTLQLPFRDMTLTRLGRLSYVQRDLDSTFTLESIGALCWSGGG